MFKVQKHTQTQRNVAYQYVEAARRRPSNAENIQPDDDEEKGA